MNRDEIIADLTVSDPSPLCDDRDGSRWVLDRDAAADAVLAGAVTLEDVIASEGPWWVPA